MKISVSQLDRRQFLRLGVGAALAATALPGLAAPHDRRLTLVNLHTGERLHTTYWSGGRYLLDELAAINQLLRDHRTGIVGGIAPQLLDQLYVLQQRLHLTQPYEVISGYRSPQTNAMLNHTTSGVAKKSLHMEGRAIDVSLPPGELKQLLGAARTLRAGGVGYYPRSGFIHLDTGPFRTWNGS